MVAEIEAGTGELEVQESNGGVLQRELGCCGGRGKLAAAELLLLDCWSSKPRQDRRHQGSHDKRIM